MSLLRQGRFFVAIGVVQWLVDWGLMVALSHLGVGVAVANVAGRVSGALLGFWLNGSITFARDGRTPGWRQLGRYVLLWGVTTALSTGTVSLVDAHFGLRDAWIAKPLVDGTLAILSFLASRHWVYR